MSLGTYADYGNVWIEITKSEHNHGGQGWEFGTCLWSPSSNDDGNDRYSLMREPAAGDLVLHFYDDQWPDGVTEMRLCGASRVVGKVKTVSTAPPSAGTWAGRSSYYRIDLRDYVPFGQPLPLATLVKHYNDPIWQELTEVQPKFYPFYIYGKNRHRNSPEKQSLRTVQGIYLARCTPQLYQTIRHALGLEEAGGSEQAGQFNAHEDYEEGTRSASERFFFARNQSLVKAAKQEYGFTCQACGFDFKKVYGDLGAGYIECHHLNPLSERPEVDWGEGIRSRLDDVTVLCANCHRMVHRQRPALSLAKLRKIISQTAK
jgi:hypothetical protein